MSQITHQQSSNNTPKIRTEKITNPISTKGGPKGDQNMTDKGGKGRDPGWNPPRKKKNTAKNRPTAGKGCMREGNTQTVTQVQHAPAVGRNTARGRILVTILVPFGALWLPFGSLWLTLGSLLAPFGSLLVPFGSLLFSPGGLFFHFRDLLAAFSVCF